MFSFFQKSVFAKTHLKCHQNVQCMRMLDIAGSHFNSFAAVTVIVYSEKTLVRILVSHLG